MNTNYLIILLNYNNWQDTFECIQSLQKSKVKGSNILVIDNCSTDDSIDKLNSETPDVKIILAERNLGFTGGNNFGIKYALENKYEYAIVLNNDTIIESENSFRTLIEEMDKNPNMSIGTGRTYFYPEKDKIWYDGGGIINWKGAAYHNNFRKNKETVRLNDENRQTDFVSGCYMCIRLKDLPRLGYMDENIFIYLDDLEYSMRAKRNDLKLFYIPSSVIYHKERGRGRHSPRLVYYSIRNRKIVINLYFGIVTKIYFNMVIIIKRGLWFFINKQYYKILNQAIRDYKNKYYGQAPDSIN